MSHIPHATSSTAHGRKHHPFFLHPLERKRSASNSQRPPSLQCASLEEEGGREEGKRNTGKKKRMKKERGRQDKGRQDKGRQGGGKGRGEREGGKGGDIFIILMHIHVHSMNQ